ncbi:hypothetical protein D9M69_499960 [compost metagenome]
MFQTGRGPLPLTRASGTVPMKPRIASSKSCLFAKGSAFAMSALAFSVTGSAALGATTGCAVAVKAQAQATRAREKRRGTKEAAGAMRVIDVSELGSVGRRGHGKAAADFRNHSTPWQMQNVRLLLNQNAKCSCATSST